jgi:predicted PurR-regulated permease PerM
VSAGTRSSSTPRYFRPGPSPRYGDVARRALVTTVVAVAVVVGTLAIWELKVLLALLFVAMTIAAAMRPGVDALAKRHIPRPVGVALHYVAVLGLIALFLSFVVPDMVGQVQHAIGAVESHRSPHGNSFKDRILADFEQRLKHLPTASKLLHPALSIGEEALAILVGIFFTFAAAAYWLFERDRAIDLVTSLLPRPKRKTVRDTWQLIDLKLGAFVRGQLLMVAIVSTLVSFAFWLVGEPYFILLGISIGILEIVPVVGPLVGLILAVGAGMSVNWQTALKAAAVLLAIRVFQDYVINPRVLGGAVGLSPLIVMSSAIAVTILLGPFYILLAVPIASLLITIVDVALRRIDPAEAEVPTVLFPAGDSET